MSHTSSQYNIQEFSSWSPSGNKKLIIAGPCSVESEKQLFSTAESIVDDIHIFRAGVWKARTNPNTFAGVGEKSLRWLKKIEEDYNIPVIIEVLSPDHVKQAIDNGIKYIWLGARTTVNSYLTDEIAQSLSGSDLRVFVKNPLVPDISLWLGAIQRINKVGITKIAAIHRGFQSLNAAPFRNEPIWDLPIKLKCSIPELPIICDPSHIAGKRIFIEEIVRKALSLDFSGLMIETHITPEEALSDKDQQLSPNDLRNLLNSISSSLKSSNNIDLNQNNDAVKKIVLLRQLIDSLDANMLEIISQRFNAVEEIGQLKKEINTSPLQVSRWNEVMENRLEIANKLGLSEEFVEKLMEIIHHEALSKQ
ncbi:bifunctional 3-deoxy-7-phosphoheptulonate synthase/chorismate mutase type II [Bacteroidales bacterium OttesenSCG-928-K03]|nr:bifunctional 3-deoxy-7-phosphoheptulonate synthase/chorismate mutase type II [Odoribacter sp. OttesenSCG-928-L07]MDL2241219.1 bifunctional 3-deoxy-7-phosphoheptulonate synthase/chorismate mutase type II [Bacteroidales bacterium OttesenSCG-928-K22]MDL2242818.1 bifunctional 3-deoxy-7-phosphoheptulonate synthase/chorismate mutase type II [Bacteroidales bacterium OttesenSCG-928-K03]